jgi:AraC family transcriptional regulator
MLPARDLRKFSAIEMSDGLEEACSALEQQLGTRITIHDRATIFHGPGGESLLPYSRNTHSHHLCLMHRYERSGWDRRCVDHCLVAVNRQAAVRRTPFVHCCWKGMSEVVVPLFRGNLHVATIFAGGYAAEKAPKLPRDVAKARIALPVLNDQTARCNAQVLQCFGQGLLAMLDPARSTKEQSGERGEIILQFVHFNLHRPVGLLDLARRLRISPSRTSHVVQSLFHKSFRQLMIEHRIARAKALLVGSDRPIKEIAARVGIGSEYYFSRLFRRHTGLPPGQFRRHRKPHLD